MPEPSTLSYYPIRTEIRTGEAGSPAWTSAQLPPGGPSLEAPALWAPGFTMGQRKAFLCQGITGSCWGREGRDRTLTLPGEVSSPAPSPCVPLGLCRICGIVPLRGVGQNLLSSPGRIAAPGPAGSINHLLVSFDPLLREGELLLWAESHLFRERAEPAVWGTRAGPGQGSARTPGFLEVLEHPSTPWLSPWC